MGGSNELLWWGLRQRGGGDGGLTFLQGWACFGRGCFGVWQWSFMCYKSFRLAGFLIWGQVQWLVRGLGCGEVKLN